MKTDFGPREGFEGEGAVKVQNVKGESPLDLLGCFSVEGMKACQKDGPARCRRARI